MFWENGRIDFSEEKKQKIIDIYILYTKSNKMSLILQHLSFFDFFYFYKKISILFFAREFLTHTQESFSQIFGKFDTHIKFTVTQFISIIKLSSDLRILKTLYFLAYISLPLDRNNFMVSFIETPFSFNFCNLTLASYF